MRGALCFSFIAAEQTRADRICLGRSNNGETRAQFQHVASGDVPQARDLRKMLTTRAEEKKKKTYSTMSPWFDLNVKAACVLVQSDGGVCGGVAYRGRFGTNEKSAMSQHPVYGCLALKGAGLLHKKIFHAV